MNVYAADSANALTGAARSARALVYVPNSQSSTLDVIDQHSLKVIAHYRVGALPQHVTPSYDLRTLYVDNDLSNSLTPIDPAPAGRGPPDPGHRSVQPLLHARTGATRSSSPRLEPPRLPNGARHAARAFARGAVPRRRPHGLQRRRVDAACELRVLGRDDRRRRGPPACRARAAPSAHGQHAAGREAVTRRAHVLRRRHEPRAGSG